METMDTMTIEALQRLEEAAALILRALRRNLHVERAREAGAMEYDSWAARSAGAIEYDSWTAGR